MKLSVMKLPVTIGCIAAALMFALLVTTCESTYVEQIIPEARLLSLKIGDLVMEGNGIPEPVDHIDWNNETYSLYGAAFKTIAFKQDSDIEDARFVPTVSRGAKVKWGVANRTTRPYDFFDTRVPATFDARDYLYFQVVSEDGKTTNYYRFYAYMSSPVRELSSIKVAGRDGDMSAIISAEEWDSYEISPGIINITQEEARENVVIEAIPWADTATLRCAVTDYSLDRVDIEPVFFETNFKEVFDEEGEKEEFVFYTIPSIRDTQYLYIEVSAENTIDKNYYCFQVLVGRIATVKTLKFINPQKEDEEEGKGTFEALGKGTAINVWGNNSGAGSFDSPHQPPAPAGFTFAVELDEPNGRWEYIKMSSLPASGNNTPQPTWIRPASNDATPNIRFEHGEYLAIKVIPPNRQGTRADFFYKVKMGNLAAEFTVQPKSHVYLKDDDADLLTFTLDRTVTNAAYQWYEANSWYGGYGFDADGRIGERGTLIADPQWGEGLKGTIDGIDYDVTEWYVKQLDEKNNVSLHNGGNQYYRLPNPGRPIPGANGTFTGSGGASQGYKPKTDYKPFITNFSNESHYYWVEITVPTESGSLKAVSARAVVVTEWGIVYKNGSPVPDDDGNDTTVDKEHYMIDLYAYQTPGAYGLQASPRNARPFNKGNHGDEYYIPVTFPPDFDILKYSVFTAQALFYLADGREWIQNWTQGDIGFARDERDDDGNKTGSGIIEEIVLWYNLTNDNATRGLASSGNQPQGGGLTVIPEYIVVKPAGTKPIKQMPPFMDDIPANYDSVGRLKPLNNDNAQGWFTPFIELCEVRFEGPTRIIDCGCNGVKTACQCDDCDCTYCE